MQLSTILAADLKAEHALKGVGEKEKAQKDDEAATLLESSVIPATDAAISLARGADLGTDWGRARREEMLSVMNDRRAELPRYVTALRAHDMEAQLASVQKQIDIERRAMVAAAAIQIGPSGTEPAR